MTRTTMTSGDRPSWLQAVLASAQEAGWCTASQCATCGAFAFRTAYWTAAAKYAGVAWSFDSARPHTLLDGVSDTQRGALVDAVIAGLVDLSSEWARSEGVGTILIDLDPPLIRHGVSMVLDDVLSGTPVGEQLGRMRVHDAGLRTQRLARMEYESPDAAEERRQAKREARARGHLLRKEQKRIRDQQRLELLGELARLSPRDRLSRFAQDAGINLDAVPIDLIPTSEISRDDLGEDLVEALLLRIDRRRGAWTQLRRHLKS